jgi:hypothetical protein
MKNRQDGAVVFGRAIAALEHEVVDLEHRVAATRALIQQLRDHAGTAAAHPDQFPRASPPRQFSQGNSAKVAKTNSREQAEPAPVASAVGNKVEAMAELKKLIAEVAKLDGLIKAEKDAAAIKKHIAAKLRAERRGGELLLTLAGKKHLPVSDPQRRRWRRVAALGPKQFEAELNYRVKLAIATLEPKPRDVNSAPPKRPSLAPEVKLTAWHTDESGALSRELTAS